MYQFNVSRRIEPELIMSDKAAALMRMFGVTTDKLSEQSISHSCQLQVEQGGIVYITGPSGAGKSLLLSEMEASVPPESSVNLSSLQLSDDKTVVDCIDDDLLSSLRFLSSAGLNDVFCMLNRPTCLSEGQQWRFRLAIALASGKQFIFSDEFCTNLDRISAAVIAYNVRRFANRNKVTFILASSHEDILIDLEPDVLVVKQWSGAAEVIYSQ